MLAIIFHVILICIKPYSTPGRFVLQSVCESKKPWKRGWCIKHLKTGWTIIQHSIINYFLLVIYVPLLVIFCVFSSK